MHDSKITSVQDSSSEQLSGGLFILVVALRADVAIENNLADFFAVLLDVFNVVSWNVCLDHASRHGSEETVALSGHLGIFLVAWKLTPSLHMVTFGDWTIRLCQTVNLEDMVSNTFI